MSSSWKPSDEERRAILFLEALGLLHDLGKLSDKFLESQAPQATLEYVRNLVIDPREVYPDCIARGVDPATEIIAEWQGKANDSEIAAPFKERANITQILQAISLKSWDGEEYNLAEMVPLTPHPKRVINVDWYSALGKSMHPALLVAKMHGIAHFEKEGDPDEKNKQPYDKTYRASPFGWEHHIPVGTANGLSEALKKLPLDRIKEILTANRKVWLNEMKKLMIRGIADNRRPLNEVTLWDWGYCVATLTKAGAAWIYRNKQWPANLNDLAWRTLRVNLDILGLYARSEKIGDLLGIRDTLEKSFQRVRDLLEVDYTVANLFYHDETGAYYLFPNFDCHPELHQAIQACFPSDLQPQISLEEPIRSGELEPDSKDHDKKAVGKLISGPRQRALQMREVPVMANNNLYTLQEEWNNKRPPNAEMCTVCGFHPIAYPLPGSNDDYELNLQPWADYKKAKARSVCRVCLDRRGRRCEEWAKEGMQGTIWTSEVADNNGRLAMLVGCLDLDGWLDGTLLSTIPVTRKLSKSPSPARLYRITETARSFWKQISDEITPGTIGQRPFRLAIYPTQDNLSVLQAKLGPFHAYEIDLDGLIIEAVWDGERFISAENLAYLARRQELQSDNLSELLDGNRIKLRERPELGKPIQIIASARVERSEKLDAYYPVIPLIAEPGICMLLIPADKALFLVNAVKLSYEEQFGRVRDRLPIHLGLVFFPRRTPIRAVLESGRAMLDIKGKWGWDAWGISANKQENNKQNLTFENEIVWRVPIVMEDKVTNDIWYPNFLLRRSEKVSHLEKGLPIESRLIKHVTELKIRDPKIPPDRGPKVFIRPSSFDFEFLDTTGRRFEISYDSEGRRRQRRTRPFLLDDLDRFNEIWDQMKNLALSQRYQVIQSIEATRESWFGRDEQNQSGGDPVFKQFVKDTLAGAAWGDHPWEKIDEKVREKMVRAGVTGELADLAELHMEIMKEK